MQKCVCVKIWVCVPQTFCSFKLIPFTPPRIRTPRKVCKRNWQGEGDLASIVYKCAYFCLCLQFVLLCVCGTDAPGRGPVPCHSETTSQSFLGSKISCPPPFRPLSPPHMCSSHQHLSPSEWQETSEGGGGGAEEEMGDSSRESAIFGWIL